LTQAGKYIFFTGIILMVIGAVIWLLGNKFGWFGNLPGDLKVEKENFRFYFPITSMILLSAAISFLIWLFRKFFQ
jgi:DUF2905 family protein